MRLELKNRNSETGELYIYDEIGPTFAGMISAEAVTEAISISTLSEIVVRVNSPGGDVFEGIAIYNALVRHPARITIEIDALAASAASLVAMAGDTIRMAPSSMMMIHNAWTVISGDKKLLRATADALDKVDGAISEIYTSRTGLSSDEIRAMLDAETWLSAQEAIGKGFATELGTPLAVSAKVAADRFQNTPAHFLSDTPTHRRKLAALTNLNARRRVRV